MVILGDGLSTFLPAPFIQGCRISDGIVLHGTANSSCLLAGIPERRRIAYMGYVMAQRGNQRSDVLGRFEPKSVCINSFRNESMKDEQ